MLDTETLSSTPRSVGCGSPRDDRFFTPRTVARSNSINSTSNSDEWYSPRFETPRVGGTPRSEGGTPRDRREMYPSYVRSNSRTDSLQFHESPRLNGRKSLQGGFQPVGLGAVQESQYQYEQGSYAQSKDDYYESEPHQSPGRAKAESKLDRDRDRGEAKGYDPRDQDAYSQSAYSENTREEDLPSGLSERDVEDVFSYARHGRVEEIERLFTKGLPVDVRDAFGNTVLTIACQNGNKRVAKGVLRRGANINARNHRGNTPLHYCYHYGYGDSLGQYLMSKGADADARNNAGRAVEQGI
mmetsp:Transcript_17158/g.38603  ORF Transcript_17158/g.38603 Transcript_17158/m.38603 type:complete len:299 (+) Transcript_17158:87-983(+)